MVHEQDNYIRNFMSHTLLLIGGRRWAAVLQDLLFRMRYKDHKKATNPMGRRILLPWRNDTNEISD